MIFEFVIFLGVLTGVLFFFAEFARKTTFGLFASVFLLFLGLWITTDGIQIHQGDDWRFSGLTNTTAAINQNLNGTDTKTELQTALNSSTTSISSTTTLAHLQVEASTGAADFSGTASSTYRYKDLTVPFADLKYALGVPLILIALGSLFYYLTGTSAQSKS